MRNSFFPGHETIVQSVLDALFFDEPAPPTTQMLAAATLAKWNAHRSSAAMRRL